MSGITAERYWRIGNYRYIFYRYLIENACKNKYGKRILDAGCGQNISSLSIVPVDSEFIGVDLDKHALLQSSINSKRKYEYVLASLDALPFKADSFSLVVCVDVLEHVEDKAKVVSEISRTTELNGFFVGSTSNLLNPFMFCDTFLPKQLLINLENVIGKHYERHSRLTTRSLARLFNKYGFKCRLSVHGFFPIQPWIYHHRHKKPTWYALLWILFDRLAPNSVKEIIVFIANKKS
jgi:2-polyprenyl-3-methyl-5-hydroxy-6-metoxy-1,4-benzoquinol methylase